MVCLKNTSQKTKQLEFGPCLVVCPSTVVNQWVQEIEHWAEGAFEYQKDVKVYNSTTKGRNKRQLVNSIIELNGIIITSYDQLRLDFEVFQPVKWFMVILDEA